MYLNIYTLFRRSFIKQWMLAVLVILNLSIIIVNKSEGRPNAANTTVKGVVKDKQGKPLPGVNIAFPEINRGTSSDINGAYRISHLPSGTYTLVFSFIGYQSQRRQITLKADTTVTINVTMKKQTLQSGTITVTGTPYASDPLTTPADVDALAGQAKFANEQTSLGASLDQLAGVSTISTGSEIGKPVIRGLSGNRVRVLDDGIAMDYQQFGVRHGPNVDPFIAKRIEVVRGAASVQYGSDALGGAVNVIPNSIPDAIGGKPFLQGEIMSEYATNNDEMTGGLHLHGAANRLGFTGTIVHRSAGNITAPDVPTFQQSNNTSAPKFSGELPHTDFDQLNGSFGLGYTTDAGQISAHYTRWANAHNFLLPNGKGLGQNLVNNTLQLKGKLQLGNHFILKPNFTYNNNRRQSNAGGANATPRSNLPDKGYAYLDLLIDSYTSHVELQHPAVGPFKGTLGAEYLHEDQHTRGQEALVPSASINNFAAYIFEKAELNKFTLSVGLRMDARKQQAEPNQQLKLPDYNAGETDDVLKQSYLDFSGSLGGTYSFTDHLALAANIGEGFRAPSMFNLHAYGVHGGIDAFQEGDPYLEPEHAMNTDLSLRWRSSRVSAKITGYRNYIRNYIFLVNTGNFSNGGDGPPILKATQGDARMLGADGHAEIQLEPWLQIHGTFEIVKGKNVDKNIANVDALPLLPASTLSGGIKLIKPQLGILESGYISLTVKHAYSKKAAGRYEPFWQFGNSPQFSDFGVASTDAYTLLNASVGFDLPLWSRPISFQLSGKNLLNTAYRDFLDTYKGYALSPGRNITLKVNIPFGSH